MTGTMDIDVFVAAFASCFHRTDAAGITSATQFKKLDEWSSLLALIVISKVDSDFGKVLTSEDIQAATTVSDLFGLIEAR